MTIIATCDRILDSRTARGSAWRAIATINGVTYEAKSRSSAVGALCRELVAGGVTDGPMTVAFDGVAGQMAVRSIHRFAGTTTSESDVPIHRAKWHPYQGPQATQPLVPGARGIGGSWSPVHAEGSDNRGPAARLDLSVSRPCDGCGAVFMPKRSDAKFCSGRCRVAAHRRAA
jgi:hypothetical protein